MKLASCKSALTPPVFYCTDRSKAVVPVLVLLFVALWFILRGDLLYVLSCVILFLCFSVLLVLRLPRLGKRELILVIFVRLFDLFDLCLFGFVGLLFLLVSGKCCGLWLWHSLDFSYLFSLLMSGTGCGLWLWHSLDFSLTFFSFFLPQPYLLLSHCLNIWLWFWPYRDKACRFKPLLVFFLSFQMKAFRDNMTCLYAIIAIWLR